jgi:hypothetical protein
MTHWSLRNTFLVVFLAAFSVRIALMFATGSYRVQEQDEVVRIAASLATQGTFADAYCEGCGPSAHSAPLYPLLLSTLFRLFGVGVAGTCAQEVFSCFLASLQYGLMVYVAALCGMSGISGFLAGLLGALLPINRWVQTKGTFEYALTGLLFVLLTLAILRNWRDRDFSPRRGAMLGLLWGIALLSSPQFILPLIVLLIYPYLAIPAARPRYWAFALTQIAVVIVCLAPWTIHNMSALGAPVWGRSNLGLEMNLSNNSGATALWQQNMANGQFARMHPLVNKGQLAHLREMGEIAYNKEQQNIAIHWIESHPGRFTILTAERIFYFWVSPLERRVQTIALATITLLGFLGLFYFARRGGFGWQYFLLLWIFFPATVYLFQQSGRTRYPIEWTSFLFAGYCLALVSRRLRSRAAEAA